MEYETLKSDYIEYGTNKFLEISKKRTQPDGTVFLNISKGYYTPNGDRRYQRGIGFPEDREIVNSLIEKLGELIEDSE